MFSYLFKKQSHIGFSKETNVIFPMYFGVIFGVSCFNILLSTHQKKKETNVIFNEVKLKLISQAIIRVGIA